MDSPESLVVAEEKDLISAVEQVRDDYRPACGSAKLVLAQFTFGSATGIFKKICGVELVIAEKLPNRAV